MVWTAPQTWTTGQTVTAADMNGDVRDNMLESAAATASAAGDVVYADAANSMGSRVAHPGTGRLLVSGASNVLVWRQPAEDVDWSNGSTSAGVTSTSYSARDSNDVIDLPSVTVTNGTVAIVVVSCAAVENNTAGQGVTISYSVSGASSVVASDAHNSNGHSDSAGQKFNLNLVKLQALTAGSNTFQMEAKVGGGTGTIARPRILVVPL